MLQLNITLQKLIESFPSLFELTTNFYFRFIRDGEEIAFTRIIDTIKRGVFTVDEAFYVPEEEEANGYKIHFDEFSEAIPETVVWNDCKVLDIDILSINSAEITVEID